MNKHINLVKKWLDDPESVSAEELEANATKARAAAAAAFAAGCAVDAAVGRAAAAKQGKTKKGNNMLYDAEKVEFFGKRLVEEHKEDEYDKPDGST